MTRNPDNPNDPSDPTDPVAGDGDPSDSADPAAGDPGTGDPAAGPDSLSGSALGHCGPVFGGHGGKGRRNWDEWGPAAERMRHWAEVGRPAMERDAANVRARGRRRPHWWPEGEPWPPRGSPLHPPWHGVRRFRRRLVFAALGFLALIVGLGMVASLLFGEGRWWSEDRQNDNDNEGRRRFPLAGLVVTATAATALATTVAYRRLGRPVGELLDAAEQVATGDFAAVKVEPDGPRDLRLLGTAFNDMATQLARTDDERRRFLADVSHELRTPLAVLQSGIEAQIDGVHPRDDQHLASLLEETHRLGRLVDDLHTLALADAGRIVLHREPVAPAALAADAVAGHQALAERNAVTLRSSVTVQPNQPPVVEADPTRLRQVLDNLLANALRHTPSGGEVVLTVDALDASAASDDGGAVRFTVTDTGPGFPPDQLDFVFDRFTRAADSQGSGLGLSIARDLVHAHGGTITAANRPDGGAVVTVSLPLGPGA